MACLDSLKRGGIRSLFSIHSLGGQVKSESIEMDHGTCCLRPQKDGASGESVLLSIIILLLASTEGHAVGMRRYALSDSQEAHWRRLVSPHFRRGSIQTLADDLETEGAAASSLRSILSDFKNGRERGLRFVFERADKGALEAKLEDAVGVPRGSLRGYLRAVRDDPASDGLRDTRVPGFFEYGRVDIERMWVAPRITSMRTPRRISTGGALDISVLSQEIEQSRTHGADGARRTFCLITGPRGTGRSSLLKRMAAEFGRAGEGAPITGPDQLVDEEDCVALIDDFGTLDGGARKALAHWVAWSGPGCLLLVAEPNQNLYPMRAPDILVELGQPDADWLVSWLARAVELAAENWSLTIDPGSMSRWYRTEPAALEVAGRPDIAGLLLRAIADADSGASPTRERVLQAVQRNAVEALKRSNRDESAAFMEAYGRRLFGVLATRVFEASPLRPGREEFCALAWQTVCDGLGVSKAVGAALESSGFAQLMADLTAIGVLAEHPTDLDVRPRSVLPIALGALLAESSNHRGWVGRLALQPDWHGALEYLAAHAPKAQILEEVLALDPPVLSESFGALARVLAAQSEEPARADVVSRAFRLTLWWWARRARARQGVGVRVSQRSGASVIRPGSEGRVGFHHPLVVLSRASRRLRALLSPIRIEDLLASDWVPESLRACAEALGGAELEEESARLACAVGAPFQSDAIFDAATLRRISLFREGDDPIDSPLHDEDFDLWWREALVPRVRDLPEGDAYLAGFAPGFDVRMWMVGKGRAPELWSRPLGTAISHGEDGATGQFVHACLFALEFGGARNEDGCRAAWSVLRRESDKPSRRSNPLTELRAGAASKLSREVRGQLATSLASEAPKVRSDSAFFGWICSEVLEQDGLKRLWESWSVLAPDGVRWRAFYEAGVSVESIVDWALTTPPSEPTKDPLRPVRAALGVAQPPVPVPAPRVAAEFLFALPKPGEKLDERRSRAAAHALRCYPGVREQESLILISSHGNPQSRSERMELSEALEAPNCFFVVPSGVEPGEQAFWLRTAQRAFRARGLAALPWFARADRAAQMDEGHEDWTELVQTLSLIHIALGSESERQAVADSDPETGELLRMVLARESPEALTSRLESGLGRLVMVLSGKEPLPGARGVASAIMTSPRLRLLLQPESAAINIMRWAAEEQGPEWVADRLAESSESATPELMRRSMRCAVEVESDELMTALIERPELEAPLGSVLASHPRTKTKWMPEAIAAWGFTDRSSLKGSPVGRVLRQWITRDRDSAIEFLGSELPDVPRATALQAWRFVVCQLAPGEPRAQALRQVLDLSSAAPAR